MGCVEYTNPMEKKVEKKKAIFYWFYTLWSSQQISYTEDPTCRFISVNLRYEKQINKRKTKILRQCWKLKSKRLLYLISLPPQHNHIKRDVQWEGTKHFTQTVKLTRRSPAANQSINQFPPIDPYTLWVRNTRKIRKDEKVLNQAKQKHMQAELAVLRTNGLEQTHGRQSGPSRNKSIHLKESSESLSLHLANLFAGRTVTWASSEASVRAPPVTSPNLLF